MVKQTLLIGCNPGTNNFTSATYQSIGSAYTWSQGEAAGAQTLFRSAGTMSDMYMYIGTNTRTVTSTFFMRKNAANGNETFTIAATTTGALHDTTHTDTVAAGDYLDISINGAANLIAVAVQSSIYTTTTDTVTRLSVFQWGAGAYTVASTTYYIPIVGYDTNVGSHDSVESHSKCRQRKPGVFKNMAVQPGTNSSTNATVFNSRLNAANGNLTISIAGGATAWVEDTTHTDTVAAGDDYCFSLTTGSGTCNYHGEIVCVDFDSVGSDCQLAQAMQSGTGTTGGSGAALNANTTNYTALEGENITNATETQVQTAALYAFTFSELTITLSANTVTASSTFNFRKNAANGNLSVTMAASTTGVFSDSTLFSINIRR